MAGDGVGWICCDIATNSKPATPPPSPTRSLALILLGTSSISPPHQTSPATPHPSFTLNHRPSHPPSRLHLHLNTRLTTLVIIALIYMIPRGTHNFNPTPRKRFAKQKSWTGQPSWWCWLIRVVIGDLWKPPSKVSPDTIQTTRVWWWMRRQVNSPLVWQNWPAILLIFTLLFVDWELNGIFWPPSWNSLQLLWNLSIVILLGVELWQFQSQWFSYIYNSGIHSSPTPQLITKIIFSFRSLACHHLFTNLQGNIDEMTREVMGCAVVLNVSVFVVITKVRRPITFILFRQIDVASADALKATMESLLKLVMHPGSFKLPVVVQTEDDVSVAAQNFANTRVTPIFLVSLVSGENLDLLVKFINLLPAHDLPKNNSDHSDSIEYRVEETYQVPGGIFLHRMGLMRVKVSARWWVVCWEREAFPLTDTFTTPELVAKLLLAWTPTILPTTPSMQPPPIHSINSSSGPWIIWMARLFLFTFHPFIGSEERWKQCTRGRARPSLCFQSRENICAGFSALVSIFTSSFHFILQPTMT